MQTHHSIDKLPPSVRLAELLETNLISPNTANSALDLLFICKANPYTRNRDGNTLLHLILLHQTISPDIIPLLIKFYLTYAKNEKIEGANPFSQNKLGLTPLQCLVDNPCEGIYKIEAIFTLLENGAPPDTRLITPPDPNDWFQLILSSILQHAFNSQHHWLIPIILNNIYTPLLDTKLLNTGLKFEIINHLLQFLNGKKNLSLNNVVSTYHILLGATINTIPSFNNNPKLIKQYLDQHEGISDFQRLLKERLNLFAVQGKMKPIQLPIQSNLIPIIQDYRDQDGNSLLHLLFETEQPKLEAIDFLIDHKADLNAENHANLTTLQCLNATPGSIFNVGFIMLLASLGANPDLRKIPLKNDWFRSVLTAMLTEKMNPNDHWLIPIMLRNIYPRNLESKMMEVESKLGIIQQLFQHMDNKIFNTKESTLQLFHFLLGATIIMIKASEDFYGIQIKDFFDYWDPLVKCSSNDRLFSSLKVCEDLVLKHWTDNYNNKSFALGNVKLKALVPVFKRYASDSALESFYWEAFSKEASQFDLKEHYLHEFIHELVSQDWINHFHQKERCLASKIFEQGLRDVNSFFSNNWTVGERKLAFSLVLNAAYHEDIAPAARQNKL